MEVESIFYFFHEVINPAFTVVGREAMVQHPRSKYKWFQSVVAAGMTRNNGARRNVLVRLYCPALKCGAAVRSKFFEQQAGDQGEE